MEESLRILLAVGSLGLGGAERQCVELACQMRSRGHAVRLAYVNDRHVQLLPRLREAEVPADLLRAGRPGDPRPIYRLAGYIRRHRFHVVHTFLFTAGYLVRPAARLAGVPVIIHGERMGDQVRPVTQRLTDRLLAIVTTHFIANSSRGAHYLKTKLGIPAARISVLWNGIDLARFNPNPHRTRTGSVLMVGRLWPDKNHLLALDVMARLRKLRPGARLSVAGDIGRSDPWLVSYCQRLHDRSRQPDLADSIDWLGYREDVPDLMADSQALLFTSSFEGCPNTVMEAMAAGLPVVASGVSDVPDIVRHGKDGFVVDDPNDVEAFAGHLARLLGDESLRNEMGMSARHRAESFAVEALAERHETLYRRLLEGPR